MAQEQTLRVTGYREFLRACDRCGKATKKEVRAVFRGVGEGVRRDAAARFTRGDFTTRGASRFVTAAGYKVRVRARGVAVEQTIRKTTGLHPEYGSLQMRHALIPALHDNEQATEKAMEHAIDEVARIFAR